TAEREAPVVAEGIAVVERAPADRLVLRRLLLAPTGRDGLLVEEEVLAEGYAQPPRRARPGHAEVGMPPERHGYGTASRRDRRRHGQSVDVERRRDFD